MTPEERVKYNERQKKIKELKENPKKYLKDIEEELLKQHQKKLEEINEEGFLEKKIEEIKKKYPS